jgi:hypothetical protein
LARLPESAEYTPTATIKSTDTLTIVDTPDGITRNVPPNSTGK